VHLCFETSLVGRPETKHMVKNMRLIVGKPTPKHPLYMTWSANNALRQTSHTSKHTRQDLQTAPVQETCQPCRKFCSSVQNAISLISRCNIWQKVTLLLSEEPPIVLQDNANVRHCSFRIINNKKKRKASRGMRKHKALTNVLVTPAEATDNRCDRPWQRQWCID